MISILIYILALVAVLQPDKERRTVAGVFCCFVLLHDIYMSQLDGFLYYGSAALFDLAIISVLSKIHITHDLVLKLQRLCIVSIIINIVGWICWYHYLPPGVYNSSFLFIYLYVLVILIQKDKRLDLGNTSMDGMCIGICSNITSSHYSLYHHKRKT